MLENLTINTDNLELTGTSTNGKFRSSISAQTQGTGDAGDFTLKTRDLLVKDGAAIITATFAQGNAGNLTINTDEVMLTGTSADGRLSALSTQTEGMGNAGNLTLTARKLFLSDQAQIAASTFGEGNTGEININADESVNIQNFGQIRSTVERKARGNSSKIILATPILALTNNSRISAATLGQGDAGNITVFDASSITLEQSNITASVSGTGDAGTINLNAEKEIKLTNNSQISSTVEKRCHRKFSTNYPQYADS